MIPPAIILCGARHATCTRILCASQAGRFSNGSAQASLTRGGHFDRGDGNWLGMNRLL